MPGELKYLLPIYGGIVFFNSLISFWLWRKNRAPIYASLFKLWAGQTYILVASGLTYGNPFAFVLFAMLPGTYFAAMATCEILLRFVGEQVPWKVARTAYLAAAVLVVASYLAGFPFMAYSAPFAAVVIATFAYCLATVHRSPTRLSSAQFGFGLACVAMALHHLDFPFIANDPAFVVPGFVIGLFIGFCFTIFGPMAIVELTVAEAARHRNERQLLEKELEVTLAVQSLLLPRSADGDLQGARISSYYRPAVRAGGDWWWFGASAQGRSHLLVGDVTGHGADSAMVTAVVASSYRTLISLRPDASITEILRELNRNMLDACLGRYFMTMTIVELDRDRYRWAMAGAPSIYHLSKQGEARAIGGVGMPLGSGKLDISEGEQPIAPGDKVLVFTDGVIDLQVQGDRTMGRKLWLRLFEQTAGIPCDRARDLLVAKIDEMKLKPQLDDDVTFVLLEKA